MNIVYVGDVLIPSEMCRAELERIGRTYDAEITALDWNTGGLEGLRRINREIETAGPAGVEPPQELRTVIGDAHVLIVHFCPVSQALMQSAPGLQVIGTLRTGLSNIDVSAARERGIELVNVPGRLAEAVSDLAIGLILALTRGIVLTHESLRRGRWLKDYDSTDSYFELQGRTVGLIGFGDIGRKVAHKLSTFGVKRLAYDPFVEQHDMQRCGVEKSSLEELLSGADVVSIHAPLTESTKCLIGAPEIGRMKTSAFLINTARAEIVEKAALLHALSTRSIAGAALDVFWEEPIHPEDPFLLLENVVITPHLGGTLKDTLKKSIIRLNERLAPHFKRLSAQV
jgi:D-3-phosphoglycerate dehydrogenase